MTHRVPLRDVEEEDLAPHLPGEAAGWAARLWGAAAEQAQCGRRDAGPTVPPRRPHLPAGASAFIDTGLASGSGVLVHCHAGKSRSCSLVLAWLMTRRRWPLNRAMEFLRRARPEAEPNAGYLAALLRLEEGLFGRQTVKVGGRATRRLLAQGREAAWGRGPGLPPA